MLKSTTKKKSKIERFQWMALQNTYRHFTTDVKDVRTMATQKPFELLLGFHHCAARIAKCGKWLHKQNKPRGLLNVRPWHGFLFFFLCKRARQGDRSRQWRRQRWYYTILCTQGSLERFLRLTQKIPISLSGAKVEHRDATILEMKPRQEPKGQNPRSKAHDGQVDGVG